MGIPNNTIITKYRQLGNDNQQQKSTNNIKKNNLCTTNISTVQYSKVQCVYLYTIQNDYFTDAFI